MTEEVEHLILAPFRDIAQKGTQTLKNAGNIEDDDNFRATEMKRAGQALMREGQRAVKRLEPLCNRHLNESGTYFVDAVKDENDITKYRWLLNEKLWEFEDYTEPDMFESTRFTALQRLSREAAPKILDVLMTMRLGVPLPLYTPPPIPFVHHNSRNAMGIQSGPDEGLEGPWPRTPPREDLVDQLSRHILDSAPEEAPVIPPKSSSRRSNSGAVTGISKQDMEGRRKSPFSPLELQMPNPNDNLSLRTVAVLPVSLPPSSSTEHARPESFSSFSPANPPIPEEETVKCPSEAARSQGGRASQPGSLRSQSSRRLSADSIQSSVFDLRSPDAIPQKNPSLWVPELHGSPVLSTSTPTSSPGSKYEYQKTQIQIPSGVASLSASTFKPIASLEEVVSPIEDGLMPVQNETVSAGFASHQPDTSIGPDSSFYKYGGFCKGAKEAQRGGVGAKKIRKRGIWNVARCKHCMFELDWDKMEGDMKDRLTEDANMGGGAEGDNQSLEMACIRLRVGFLLKSHLLTKNADECLYGCIFCIAQGHTTEEADATVFFTRDQLFSHLARHPRPLPLAPGVLVADGSDDTLSAELVQTRDLYFTNPPAPPALASITRDLARLPTATAVETIGRSTPIPPPDRTIAALQFAVGARVVGVQFPDRYDGEWATGWADGIRGAFPVDATRLETPPPGEVKLQLSSSLVATARWKWAPKERGGSERGKWLRLYKGETITNICWAYADHWCWSGTNSKGTWGLFPQSHVNPRSLRDLNRDFHLPERSDHGGNPSSPPKSSSKRGSTILSSAMRILPLRRDSSVSETKGTGPRLVIY